MCQTNRERGGGRSECRKALQGQGLCLAARGAWVRIPPPLWNLRHTVGTAHQPRAQGSRRRNSPSMKSFVSGWAPMATWSP